MAIVEANPNLGAQIVADAKEHILYSWSVQSQINPIAVAGAEGRHFWDYDGKRYLDDNHMLFYLPSVSALR